MAGTSKDKQEMATKSSEQKQGHKKRKKKRNIQIEEKIVTTPDQKKKETAEAPVPKKQGKVGSSGRKQKRRTKTSRQKQKRTVHTQKHEKVSKTPVQRQEIETRSLVQKTEEISAAHVEKVVTGVLVRKQKEMPEAPIEKQQSITDTAEQKQERVIETAVQKQETTSIGSVDQKQEEVGETPLQKEEITVGTSVQEISMREQSATPTQEEAIKSITHVQEEDTKLPDASENERLQVSTVDSMQLGPTVSYVQPSFLLPQGVHQEYAPVPVPPFPQHATPAYRTVSVPLYSVPFDMQMVRTRSGMLYSHVPQQYIQPYPLQPNMQMIETRSGPLYSQVPQQYGSVPLLPQFPLPPPVLILQPVAGIPTHALPGQVIPQLPPAVAAPPIVGIPAEALSGGVMPQFLPPVPGLPVPPVARIPAEPLPGEVLQHFPLPLPGPPVVQFPGPDGQVLQQFGAPHPGQSQLAPGPPPLLPVPGFPQYNQPYIQGPPGLFPRSESQQFVRQTQQYKSHYTTEGIVVTEVTVHLSNPSINLSVAGNLGYQKTNIKKKDEPKEMPKPIQVKFIYGEGSMIRIEGTGTEDTWKQPAIKLWPYARKHRRDRLLIRHQAQMIEKLFLQGLPDSQVACADQKLEISLENMPEKVLIKIFKFIAHEKNNNPNVSIYNMYRLKLICRRFNNVLENNAKILPRYQISGIRVRSKGVGLLGDFTMVYRYGTGAFEPPCACFDLVDLPFFLRHDIIDGFVHIDRMELTDGLFIALNELTYGENVQKIVFSNIYSVSLTPESGLCTFLDKFPGLLDLLFFGNYDEDELNLKHSQVVMQMQRSESGNGILTFEEMKEMMERFKYKRKMQNERSKRRAAVRRKAVVQSKAPVKSKADEGKRNGSSSRKNV